MTQAARRKAHPPQGRSRTWAVVAVIAVAALALSASLLLRGRGGGPARTSPSDLPPAPDTEIVLYQGEEVAGGERVALSALWERKPVVLNFWAGLCPPCRAEMPDFQRVYDARKDQFILIGVDIGPFIGLGSRDDAKALLRELRITYPAGTTFDERTVRNYQILGMPTTVFITPQGRIVRKHTGLLTRAQMEGLLSELLRASSVP